MRSLVVLLAALGFAVVAHADDVDLRVDARAQPGQAPKLTLVVNKDVATAVVDLRGDGGGYGLRAHDEKGPASSGSRLEFALPHKAAGRVAWKGSLTVTFADGASGTMPLAFQTEVLSSDFRFDATSGLDLAHDRLTVKSERATSKIEIDVYTDDDDVLASTAETFDPVVPAGQPASLSWSPKKKADVLRLHVTVYDENGTYRSTELFPYSISIPHDDVVFDSGKSVIRAEQEPKLTAALPEIEKATKRFGPAMKAAGASVKLFVAGHTDTVGDSASNRALSQARALAIAKWFRAHGCPVAVYARGFGEDALKVPTGDNAAEERNRRVEYDVGVNGPTGATAGWARID